MCTFYDNNNNFNSFIFFILFFCSLAARQKAELDLRQGWYFDIESEIGQSESMNFTSVDQQPTVASAETRESKQTESLSAEVGEKLLLAVSSSHTLCSRVWDSAVHATLKFLCVYGSN